MHQGLKVGSEHGSETAQGPFGSTVTANSARCVFVWNHGNILNSCLCRSVNQVKDDGINFDRTSLKTEDGEFHGNQVRLRFIFDWSDLEALKGEI